MATIEVEGKKYQVVETLSPHAVGMRAKFVGTPDGERVAIFRSGRWEWWTMKDRLRPLVKRQATGEGKLPDAPRRHEYDFEREQATGEES